MIGWVNVRCEGHDENPTMNSRTIVPEAAARDAWAEACSALALLSLLLIIAGAVGPAVAAVNMPYAAGGSVVLGIGAVASLTLRSRTARVAASIGLVSLMLLRLLAPIRPDLLIATHGELSAVDAVGTGLLVLAAVVLVLVATRGTDTAAE